MYNFYIPKLINFHNIEKKKLGWYKYVILLHVTLTIFEGSCLANFKDI